MRRSAHALRPAGLLALALLFAHTSPPAAAAAHRHDDRVAATAAAFQAPVDSAAPADTTLPRYVGYVNDFAHVLDEPSRAKLESFLDQVQRKTGVQFAVLTMPTTAPYDPSEYKTMVFQRWGIGDRERRDGLLMLLALAERDLRFETGYGLEGALPDGLQSRIFRREMAPRFQSGDFGGGITQGVLACAAVIAKEHGVTLTFEGTELRYDVEREDRGRRGISPWLVALIVFLIVMNVIGSSSRRRRRGWNRWGGGGFGGGMWGGGFGGGGFGGGGFGGFGGGSSGGGGGFGGFGGGSSGGGGGGGHW